MLHITFTDGSNPYVKFYYCDNPKKARARDLRSWKRHYVVIDQYTTDDDDLMITVRQKTYAEEAAMNKANKEYYERMKRRARNNAIFWQEKISNESMSYEELAEIQSHFEALGKRYGLLNEFRENGII